MGILGKLFGISSTPAQDAGSQILWNGDGYGTRGNVFSGLGNLLTGNLDYDREKELQSISNAFSASQAAITRDFNASEAQKARDFSAFMSSTAYQRAMADMKASGLNPALAFSQGGASTPSAYAASASAGHGASASAGKSGQAFTALITALLGGAFRVATTSMVNEAQMAQTLARSNSAYKVAELNADEYLYRDDAWRSWYDKGGRRH